MSDAKPDLEMIRVRHTGKRCKTCDNFQPPLRPQDNGECHRGSPSVLLIPAQGPPQMTNKGIVPGPMRLDVNATYPPVLAESWCHDWTPIEDENWVHGLPVKTTT